MNIKNYRGDEYWFKNKENIEKVIEILEILEILEPHFILALLNK